jgi:sugar diacid utilization regulator
MPEGLVRQPDTERDLLALCRRAADMVRVGDVDAVCRAAVRWTRELLGSDVAYVTVYDEATGDFYVRNTEGFVSEAFVGIRSPIRGFGVYGFIIDHGRPFWSPDYANDERFPHLPETSHAIATEGILGLLGAPAPLPSREIPAVIFAGWRREGRQVTDDEIALLVAWGLLVGAAIDNAMHAEAAADRQAELEERTADLEQSVAVLRRLSDVRQRLSDGAAQGGSTEDIVEMLRAELAHDVELLDEPPEDDAAGDTVVPITSREEVLGALRVRAAALDTTERQILDYAALVLGAQLVSQERIANAEKRAMGDVVTGLLKSPQDNLATLRHQASRYRVDLRGAALGMVVGDLGAQPAGKALDRARRCLVDDPALIGLYDGRMVVIAPSADRELAERLHHEVTRPGSPATVVAMPGPLAETALPETYQRAVRSLQLVAALGRQGAVASDEELAPFAVAFGGMDAPTVEAFVDRAIGPLIRQDAQRGTELVRTLVTYLDHGLNIRETSAALYVHGNTVRQRLTATSRLLPALDDPVRRLDLHLAARLHLLRVELRP